MFHSSLRARGFTLIEILVVVLIIGVLISVFLPKIRGLQASARDAERISDLTYIANGLTSYYFDYGSYPNTGSIEADKVTVLVPEYLTEVPFDPKSNFQIDDFIDLTPAAGSYVFMPDNDQRDGAMLVIAKMETQQRANLHLSGPFSGAIFNPTDIDWSDIEAGICKVAMTKVGTGEATAENPCEFEDPDKLRYVILRYN